MTRAEARARRECAPCKGAPPAERALLGRVQLEAGIGGTPRAEARARRECAPCKGAPPAERALQGATPGDEARTQSCTTTVDTTTPREYCSLSVIQDSLVIARSSNEWPSARQRSLQLHESRQRGVAARARGSAALAP